MVDKDIKAEIEDFMEKLEKSAPGGKPVKAKPGAPGKVKKKTAKAKGKAETGGEPQGEPVQVTGYAMCEKCNKGFSSVAELVDHLSSKHFIEEVKSQIAALLNPPEFTDKVTDPKDTTDGAIIQYISYMMKWKPDLTLKLMLALVLDKFPLLHISDHLLTLIPISIKTYQVFAGEKPLEPMPVPEEVVKKMEAEAQAYEDAKKAIEDVKYFDYLKDMKSVLDALEAAYKADGKPTPEQPILFLKHGGVGYAVELWSGPPPAPEIPLLPEPGENEIVALQKDVAALKAYLGQVDVSLLKKGVSLNVGLNDELKKLLCNIAAEVINQLHPAPAIKIPKYEVGKATDGK